MQVFAHFALMPPKHLKLDMDHNVIDRKGASKTRVKAWVEPEWLKEYRLERDRVIWRLHPESRKEIEEYYLNK